MRVYFSATGGAGMSALAHLCLDLGYQVFGSDREKSLNCELLEKRGVEIDYIQDGSFLERLHQENGFDWLVFSPAVKIDHPERQFAIKNNIQSSKQNGLLEQILKSHDLKLMAVSGTHGKTTTTAMLAWTFKKLNLPVSWVIGTNISFGNSGHYDQSSEYLVYEADEFDKKLLDLKPYISLVTNIDYDHPDTYKTQSDYYETFAKFIDLTSQKTFLWDVDVQKLKSINSDKINSLLYSEKVGDLKIAGRHNRLNGNLVFESLKYILKLPEAEIKNGLESFPGVQRRMEELKLGLYSDYAHHPVEISASLQLAKEIQSQKKYSKIVVVYQPHQNIRQHSLIGKYTNCFDLADKVYWLPTYLSREDPKLKVLQPSDLIQGCNDIQKFNVTEKKQDLLNIVTNEISKGAMVICMGAGDIDPWVRSNLGLTL